MKKKPEKFIDFTAVDWNSIDDEKLRFCFKEAVEANDSVLTSIDNINNKAYQFLAIASAMAAALVGFLLSVWGEADKKTVTVAALFGCIWLGLIMVALLLAILPRMVYLGRATPESMFSSDLYKSPMVKLLADGIASYHHYICSNRKVVKFRSFFLTIGICGFFLIPFVAVVLLLFLF